MFDKPPQKDVCDRAVYSNQQEKDRECFYTLCPLFLTSTASVSTEAILILSICHRFARLDIFALLRNIFALLRNIFRKSANQICFRSAQTRYDINPRSRSEHIECVSTYRARSVYRKSASADLYRGVPALWQVRQGLLFI